MRITDPKAMRALAHPLRLDLIEALTELGPSTAAICARHLGSTQALCSFHLRQLAKYGFVEPAQDGGDKRERPWRLTDIEQSWSNTGESNTGESNTGESNTGESNTRESNAGEGAAQQLDRVFVQREADKMLRWVGRSRNEPEEWRRAAFAGGATLPVTPEELDDIAAKLRAVLEPYLDRLTDHERRPANARSVRIMLAGTPQKPKEEDR
jgi:DNA-binding MarR family transcriptional regulator